MNSIESIADSERRTFPQARTRPDRPVPQLDRFLSMNELKLVTSLSRASIYRKIQARQFPAPILIADHRVAWSAREVAEWQRDLRNAREDVAA